jgi:TonB family protein
MTYYALSEPLWRLSEDVDQRFRRSLLAFFIPLLILGILVPFLQLAGLQRGGGVIEGDRYAELLKQQPPAPIAPKQEEPKKAEEHKPKEEPVEPKPKPEAKPQPQPDQQQQVQQARQVASHTGVMAFADQLADLRDEKLKSVDETRALSSVVTAKTGTGDSSGAPTSFAQAMQSTSGGISGAGTGDERRAQSGTGLGTRRTSTVQSPVGFGEDKTRPGQGGDKLVAGRTLEEIQLTFDRNKGAFYAIFNRAMRDNPNLAAGKIVVSITIAPDGSVTDCRLVSSTFNDPELERKVIQRVELLNFGAKAVPPFTYPNYPINFLPS